MGANLICRADNFEIREFIFPSPSNLPNYPQQIGDTYNGGVIGTENQLRQAQRHYEITTGSITDKCISEGSHKILSFDFYIMNIGNEDLDVPQINTKPELYVKSEGHRGWWGVGHWHFRDMNKYILYDSNGVKVREAEKQSFCLDNSGIMLGANENPDLSSCELPIETIKYPLNYGYEGKGGSAEELCNIRKKYGCLVDEGEKMGISYGWFDKYHKNLACQFIVIDDLLPGDYTLECETNQGKLIGFGLHVLTGTIAGNIFGQVSLFWKRIAPYNSRHGIKMGMIVGVILWAVLFIPVASLAIQPMLDSFNTGITPNQYVYSIASNFDGLFSIIIVGSLIFHLIYGALLGYMSGRMMEIRAFTSAQNV